MQISISSLKHTESVQPEESSFACLLVLPPTQLYDFQDSVDFVPTHIYVHCNCYCNFQFNTLEADKIGIQNKSCYFTEMNLNVVGKV